MRGCNRAAGIALIMLLGVCAPACQRSTSRASAAGASGEAASGGETADANPAQQNGRREMTWDEYYRDVEQRAHRSGGFVMWCNPPRLARRPAPQVPPGSTPMGGAPLSGPVPNR